MSASVIKKRRGTFDLSAMPPGLWRYEDCTTKNPLNNWASSTNGLDFYVGSSESIAYTNSGYKHSNFCDHVKRSSTVSWFTGYWKSTLGGRYMSMKGMNRAREWFGPLSHVRFEPSAADLENFNAEAFDAMKPSLEGDLSLTNFLLEMGDIKHLIAFINKWRGPIKKIAEGHLSYSFGIKPMISDLTKLWNSLNDWEEQIQKFIDSQGKLHRAHYKKTFLEVDDDDVTYSYGVLSAHRTAKGSVKMYATMMYRYKIPDEAYLLSTVGKLQALRDIFGLRLTADVIWEAIPFSFVIDWFWSVQDFLEQFRDPLIAVNTDVVDYCISHKVTIKENGYADCVDTCVATMKNFHSYSFRYKVYRRRRVLPSSGTYFTGNASYGANQQALSASLLLVRR